MVVEKGYQSGLLYHEKKVDKDLYGARLSSLSDFFGDARLELFVLNRENSTKLVASSIAYLTVRLYVHMKQIVACYLCNVHLSILFTIITVKSLF